MGEKEQGAAEDASGRYMKVADIEGERWKGAGDPAAAEGATRPDSWIKMGRAEGERWKGGEAAGADPGGGAPGIAIGDQGATEDKTPRR